jgi:very-short-patch-repair endonuclease/predicted transcriptional regulator of viral defense system
MCPRLRLVLCGDRVHDRHPVPRSSTPRESRVRPLWADQLDTHRHLALPDQAVAALAAEEKGVLSVDELRACGLSRHMIASRVERGWLHQIHRGVYAVGHATLSLEAVMLAAVKACGVGAVLSHFSAAAHWRFVNWDEGRCPEVTVKGSSTRVHRGIRVHRTKRFDRKDVVRHRGIWVTSPARTLLDLAAVLGKRALRRAVREAFAERRVSLLQLVEVCSRLGPCRGSRRLQAIIAGGYVPTRTELEDVVLDLILKAGFEAPEVNKPLLLGGRRVVPDFRWPGQKLIVEADGAAWHDHKLAREDDAERQALLEAHGERVVRITWQQAIRLRRQTISRLENAGAPRPKPRVST